jgi:hypothetical protein
MKTMGMVEHGKLYHQGRVVVGEAMVDAYRLETKIAQTARIVVSSRISSDDRLFIDADGERCLDYMDRMMLLAEDRYGDAKAWAREHLTEIETTIKGLRPHEAAKWVYFRDKLCHAMETWS